MHEQAAAVNQPPAKFVTYEGLPSDHYLWLTGQAGRILRGEAAVEKELYLNTSHKPVPAEP
jgi:hypothetical protein